MAKLYPPNINGTIPAFYTNYDQGTTKIVVPFSMNRAVSIYEISAMMLKIKSLNGTLIGVVRSSLLDASNCIVTFDVKSLASKFTVGSYYKIQIAYISKTYNEVGYYSTVGVIKYTTLPTVTIDGLVFTKINTNRNQYVGVYSQDKAIADATEKLYTSRFIVYEGNNIFWDSGEILHDNTTDEERYKSTEQIKIPKELEVDKSYTIIFEATTTNGIHVSSKRYRIIQRRSVDPNITAELMAVLNYENGYILLKLKDEVDPIVSGNFLVCRASNINNWQWEQIKNFNLQSTPPDEFRFLDCTIEQGVIYRYSLQQFNDNGIYSNRIVSNDIQADFEDAFLYDGKRQLRIRFNPNVSSFKTDMQETKIDTIGSKYPFFVRNNRVNYKEFPIQGLISYLMDENSMFISKEELGLELISLNSDFGTDWSVNRQEKRYNTSTQLSTTNFAAERIFKLTVLDWLNNGKPKAFRSPGEGNYLVRLMNVSLSPNETVSRMLHSFNCTAYEVGDYNLENLAQFDIFDPIESVAKQRRWMTVDIKEEIKRAIYTQNNLNYNLTRDQQIYEEQLEPIYNQELRKLIDSTDGGWFTVVDNIGLPEISIQDLLPGSKIRIDGEEIVIGSTGAYKVVNNLNPFSKLEVNLNSVNSGLITYGFDAKASDVFGTIEEVIVQDVPCRQIVGNSYWKDKVIVNKKGEVVGVQTINNIYDFLQNNKTTILKINLLKVTKRPIIDAFLEPTGDTLSDVRIALREAATSKGRVDMILNVEDYNRQIDLSYKMNELQRYKEFLLPLYQIRMPRTDYRETESVFAVTNFAGDEQQFHYIYQDAKPYTFEQYYIDKNMDRFCPYTGYMYDPCADEIIAVTDDLFHFYIDEEDFSVQDVESWQTRDISNNTTSIIFNRGVIGELTYSQQTTTFQFDSAYGRAKSQSGDVFGLRVEYEKSLAIYLLAREGRKSQNFTNSLMDYIEGYLPNAYLELYKNKAVYNDYIIQLVDVKDTSPEKTPTQLSDELNSESKSNQYQQSLNNLKANMINNYNTYIESLNQTIEEYRKANGLE